MPTYVLTRRAALLSFGAFAAAGLGGCNTTPTAGVQPGRRAAGLAASAPINVDTTPLVAYVGNPTARLGAAGSARRARSGVSGRASRRATPARTLNVRIDTLYLGGGGPADPDRMRGVAMLGGHTISVRAVSTYYFRARPIRRCRSRLCRAGCRRWRWPSPTG